MSMTLTADPVVLWTVGDVPARMLHDGRWWRVTDSPTALHEPAWAVPFETPEPLTGWRFQGTDVTGLAQVFDVVRHDGGWAVLHTWC